jgi:hypothetical protein
MPTPRELEQREANMVLVDLDAGEDTVLVMNLDLPARVSDRCSTSDVVANTLAHRGGKEYKLASGQFIDEV